MGGGSKCQECPPEENLFDLVGGRVFQSPRMAKIAPSITEQSLRTVLYGGLLHSAMLLLMFDAELCQWPCSSRFFLLKILTIK